MKKIAIVGASYLQEPLIQKAKEMGLETHVFAWKCGDIGEKSADYFYPISIVEKEDIANKCREIGVNGICSIASDLASITVNYVANELGLVGNPIESIEKSTNKHTMRECFFLNGDPSPKSILVENESDLNGHNLKYPIIVKPLDRSGSRGITKLESSDGLFEAIENAKKQGFIKKALVEEYVTGKEYSVECISYNGKHTLLAITQKYTTGAPHFIETGHSEPANLSIDLYRKIETIIFHALNSLDIKYGASHSEIKIEEDGSVYIIEIGGRMGGDYIGSHLVHISTGVDFVKAVIQVALGEKPILDKTIDTNYAGVRFILSQKDLDEIEQLVKNNPEMIVEYELFRELKGTVTDSSNRFGVCVFKSNNKDLVIKYLGQ